MINKVTLLGRLGKDPEIRHFDNNIAVCNFSLATDRGYKDKNGEWQNETEWHNLVIWKPWLINTAEKYLKKGSLVYIEGRLATRSWDDQTGNKKYTTEIIVEELKLTEKRGDSGNGNFPPPPKASDAPSVSVSSKDTETTTETKAPSTDDVADDLPF